jgi:truncated hemoglobin YjbI
MPDIDFANLTRYAKAMANLTQEQEQRVLEVGARVKPHLGEVTEAFYERLMGVPEAKHFLDGRVDRLKKAHEAWLTQVFAGPHDETYTAYLYNVGDIHVRVNLPVEFMAAGIGLISQALREKVSALYGGDCCGCRDTMMAIDNLLSYSLIVMQNSYQGSMEAQLEKFLAITGITRALYGNMARAYRG